MKKMQQVVCRNCEYKVYREHPYYSLNLRENCGHPAIENFCLLKFQKTKNWAESKILNIEKKMCSGPEKGLKKGGER